MTHEAIVYGLYNSSPDSLLTVPKPSLEFDEEGIKDNKYRGLTKPSDTRDRERRNDPIFPKGQEVDNWRMWSAVSSDNLKDIATYLRIPYLSPTLFGANIAITNIENFSKLPEGTLLHLGQDAVLLVEAENLPCVGPGEEIAKIYTHIKPNMFVKAAFSKRGLVGTVKHPGIVKIDDAARVELYRSTGYSIPASK